MEWLSRYTKEAFLIWVVVMLLSCIPAVLQLLHLW
jgi:hypothetical protein